MKKIFFILVLFLTLINVNVQAQPQLPKISIKSIKPLLYDTRVQASDTVYIAIRKWVYNTDSRKFSADITDYIKVDNKYKSINNKSKVFTVDEINALFTSLNNSILTTELYSSEFDKLLLQALLLDTRTNLLSDGKTVYGGNPADWTVIPL
jgi:hypothetical protein